MSTEGEETFENVDAQSSSGTSKKTNKPVSNVKPQEFKVNKESRASEAMKVKDDQIRLLTEQNNTLLKQLDKLEDEFTAVQTEHKAMENENDALNKNMKEMSTKLQAYESQNKRSGNDIHDRDNKIKILSQQNAELLRNLENSEAHSHELNSKFTSKLLEYDDLNLKYSTMIYTCKQLEESSANINRENSLKNDEIRLLKVEIDQLTKLNQEMKMKVEVEMENLQEQLRVRKEKQYQLLEKVNVYDEAKRQAEDKVYNLEDTIRSLQSRNGELESILNNEMKMKLAVEDSYKNLQNDNNMLFINCKELTNKNDSLEKVNLKLEAEARDSSEQLREMAEKVFQLLERLKLTELSKSKAMESLKKKENEFLVLNKQFTKLQAESAEFAKLKEKFETEKKDFQEQLKAIRKHNQNLVQKSKDEASEKLAIIEQNESIKESMKVTEARLSFLLNKVQSDEDARIMHSDDRKKLESQVMKLNNQCEEYNIRINEMMETNRNINLLLKSKAEELNSMTLKYEDTVKELNQRDADDAAGVESLDTSSMTMLGAKPGAPDDIENVRLNEGRGRFYLEAKTTGAGAILVLKGRKPLYSEWLDKQKINEFLRKAQKTTRFREMMIEKLAMIFGLFMVEEEEKLKLLVDISNKDMHIEQCIKSIEILQNGLAVEEEAKRRMLLRYVHVTKDNTILKSTSDQLQMQINPNYTNNNANGGKNGCGVLQLLDSNITDEEMHALAALLRNDITIEELHLRNNNITDDGARALGAVLAGRTSLRLVDLRGNKIGKPGVRILAEALERSERVSHVYVHIGGKIEALGKTNNKTNNPYTSAAQQPPSATGDDQQQSITDDPSTPMIGTLCIVDVRDNNANDTDSLYHKLVTLDTINFSKIPNSSGSTAGGANGSVSQMNSLNAAMSNMPHFNNSLASSTGNGFNPSTLLNNSGIPSQNAIESSGGSRTITSVGGSKGKKKQVKALTANSSQSLPSSSSGNHGEHSQSKMIENMKLALRENLWQGRQGGLDVMTSSGLPVNSDIIPNVIKQSQQTYQAAGRVSSSGGSKLHSGKSISQQQQQIMSTSLLTTSSNASSSILPPLNDNSLTSN